MDKRRIYAALHEDIAEGFVWLKQDGLPARSIVKITYDGGGKSRSVYCEALQFENNFLRRYNRGHTKKIDSDQVNDSVVMNHWYRAKLGGTTPLTTQEPYSLRIVRANRWWGKLRAPMQHPQVVVRVAIWLALLSLLLGLAPLVRGGTRYVVAFFHPKAPADTGTLVPFQLPTATEIFNLRSKCAEFSDQRTKEYANGHPGDQIHRVAHYDQRSNRCYVELNTMLNDHAGGSIIGRVLYEGQTGELLALVTTTTPSGATVSAESGSLGRNWEAFARSLGMDPEKGRWKNGDSGQQPASEENVGFVSAFIDKAMADGN